MRTVSVLWGLLTACLDWVHGYVQKSLVNLYLSNVIFTFKLTLECMNTPLKTHCTTHYVLTVWTRFVNLLHEFGSEIYDNVQNELNWLCQIKSSVFKTLRAEIHSQFQFSIENLTMIPASDWKINGKDVKAYSLSYNILKFQRKMIKDKWATAPRTLTRHFRVLTKFNPHRHNT